MKKIIIPISALFVTGLSHAQTLNLSTNENYVYSKTYLTDPSSSTPKAVESVQYIDGLGRPKQVVNIKASPLGRDVVTHIEYDAFGRQVKDFLPIPQSGTSNGAIVANPLTNATQTGIYGSEKIYSEKILENSPLDRIGQQIQVGNDWNNKPVQFDYDANDVSDRVGNFITTTTWIGDATKTVARTSNNVLYGTAQLYKNTVTDEDGNKTIEFKNGKGQIILVRKVLSTTENADTYYVYNEYNQLALVIPPKASFEFFEEYGAGSDDEISSDILDNLCYQYKYDGRNRLVEKKLPGKGWEYMVYDKADRLIFTQDANLRQQGKWLFSKYDQFGRVIYTGIILAATRASLQNTANNYIVTDSRSLTGFTKNGIQVYYTNVLFNEIQTLLSVNYYDTYPADAPAIPTQILGQSILSQDSQNSNISTKSLPVASYVKNIEDDNWTKNYTWYDTKGRAIGTHSINHLGGYTKTESEVDFSGTPRQAITRHKRLDSDTEKVIIENFTYDHQNRLLTHTHQVDNNPVEYLAQNTYNELSQLTTKKVGGTALGSGHQIVDYQYNIRGWMTKINDLSNMNGKLFGYEIRYNNPVNTSVASGRYNGNIAEVDWFSSDFSTLQRYSYVYDALNRLKDGIYTEPHSTTPNNNFYNEHLSYDLNGNIATLKRNAHPFFATTAILADDLTYQYTGNRLDKITETSLNDMGYEGGNNIINYDANGNMKDMKDKGISGIVYNYLNLPNLYSITQTNGLGISSNYTLSYLYRADGVKLRKTYGKNGGNGVNISSNITDYLDGFQYTRFESSSCLNCKTEVAYEERAYSRVTRDPGMINLPEWILDFVPTAEGFYSFKENRYIYQYRDHLGNARISYAKNSAGDLEITDSNNYYPFGLNHIGGEKAMLNGYMNYKFQEQELQETGFYAFKWRQYMPDVGRFFNIDPLSEKYAYQSHYNFSENRVIDGRELEGLEWVRSTTLNQDGTKTYTLNANIKLVNSSRNFTSENMKDFQTSYVNNMKNSYNGSLTNGDKVEIGKINFETVDSVKDGDYSISIVDQVVDIQGNPVTSLDGETDIKGMIQLDGQFADPTNGYIGNTQQNNMQVVPSGKNGTGEAAAHETGHTFGLRHNTDSSNPIKNLVKLWNLMNAPRMGNGIVPEQRDIVIQNIPDEKETNP